MKLLWRETGFELVGAFCVAGFAFGAVWLLMGSILGLSAVLAGLFGAAAGGWALEIVSRHHYADELASPPVRQAPRWSVRAAAAGAQSSPPANSGSARGGGPVKEPRRRERARPVIPAEEGPSADHGEAAATGQGRPAAATVAGKRAGAGQGARATRRAA